ncbi:YxiJ-like family protein [Peribacillus aracenensis]|uniref:YxiJ-like family protein n=1 Tax=Peribacillus aracenensis TaxID=2976708 RepID=UPI0021A7C908|nr:YxiJ-like family protein [Peribacillus sp. BBB004]
MKVEKELLLKLRKMETLLKNDFPSEDIERIENTFFNNNSKYCLMGDFDSFCSLISGSLGYVNSNKKIPKYQRNLLYKDFFTLYPQYEPLKEQLDTYPDFSQELFVHERVRELLLDIVKMN